MSERTTRLDSPITKGSKRDAKPLLSPLSIEKAHARRKAVILSRGCGVCRSGEGPGVWGKLKVLVPKLHVEGGTSLQPDSHRRWRPIILDGATTAPDDKLGR